MSPSDRAGQELAGQAPHQHESTWQGQGGLQKACKSRRRCSAAHVSRARRAALKTPRTLLPNTPPARPTGGHPRPRLLAQPPSLTPSPAPTPATPNTGGGLRQRPERAEVLFPQAAHLRAAREGRRGHRPRRPPDALLPAVSVGGGAGQEGGRVDGVAGQGGSAAADRGPGWPGVAASRVPAPRGHTTCSRAERSPCCSAAPRPQVHAPGAAHQLCSGAAQLQVEPGQAAGARAPRQGAQLGQQPRARQRAAPGCLQKQRQQRRA